TSLPTLVRISAWPRTFIAAVSSVNCATITSPASSRSEWCERVSLPRVRPMITTPSSSALTTMYRPLASSSSVTVPPSISIGLRLRPHRFQSRRGATDQLLDLRDQCRTGQHMITIGIHHYLAAPNHHVQHHLVGPGMPRQHRLEAVGQTGVAARNPHVDQLPARDRHAFRVIPQPRHVRDDG